jgi:hypothetical protein
MTTSIDWGEFQGASGDWQKFRFEAPGDAISGILQEVRIATMPDGTRMPALTIRTADGTDWSLLASQIGLQRALAQHRPATGDQIAIVFTGESTDVKPGKSPAKLFDVVIKRGDDPAAAAPVAPAPAAPAPAPTVSAADLL